MSIETCQSTIAAYANEELERHLYLTEPYSPRHKMLMDSIDAELDIQEKANDVDDEISELENQVFILECKNDRLETENAQLKEELAEKAKRLEAVK